MIQTYLNKRLEQWAAWAFSRHLGGSSTSCMTGLIDIFQGEFIRSTVAGRIPINPDAEEIEYIVTHRLPDQHRAVLIQHYIMQGNISQRCRRLGVSRPTYYNRLRLAEFRVSCELESKPFDSKGKVRKCAQL